MDLEEIDKYLRAVEDEEIEDTVKAIRQFLGRVPEPGPNENWCTVIMTETERFLVRQAFNNRL